MSITDPKKSIEYYTEVAKLNQERAREDVNTRNELQSNGVSSSEIKRQLQQIRMSRPLISDEAYQSVFGQGSASAKSKISANDRALIDKYLKPVKK